MRRQLIIGAAAVTATVVIAFVVPLGLAVRVLAANRPLNAAEQVAQSVATVFALTDDTQVGADAVVAAQARTDAALTVFYRDGRTLGADAPRTAEVDRAFSGVAFAADIGNDRHIFVPVTRAEGTVAVVRAVVSGAELRRGVTQSWLLLLGLALGLLAFAIVLADALGRSVVKPTRELAATARRVAAGDLSARVSPAGPPEVADVGGALNGLAGRITELLAAEREMVADLSHRLRTPLTALRLDAEAVADPDDRNRLRGDVDAVEATVTELIREAREPAAAPPQEPIDLVPIVRERADYWGALADDQGRTWELNIATQVAPVRLRPADAEALLDVLLDNVFSHTGEGTPYWIRLERNRLVIEDAGPGFSTPLPSRRGRSDSGSTGLGLDIARQTIQRAGGRLEVAPRQPRGARVEVVLATDAG
jgi:signal transduction histidine kinase